MPIWRYPDVPLLDLELINNTRNYYPNKRGDFVSGRSLSNIQNTYRDLWEGPTATYVAPATPIQMQVVSTSANDTAAGTGVQIIHIHYLDNAYNAQTLQVTLNGVTPVLTVPTNILRINGMHALAVGTNLAPVGNISLQSVGGAVTYAFMSAGDVGNRARQAMYTIPSGKTGYLKHFQGASGSAAGSHFVQIEILATVHEGLLIPGVFIYQDSIAGQNVAAEMSYEIPIVFPATCDVKVTAVSDAANANATAIGTLLGWIE